MNPKHQTMADAIARLGKEVESYRDTGLVDDEPSEVPEDVGPVVSSDGFTNAGHFST